MTPRHPAQWDGERMNTTEATSVAREAGNSAVVEWGARLGYAGLGLLHLLIARSPSRWPGDRWRRSERHTSGALGDGRIGHRQDPAVDLRRRLRPARGVAVPRGGHRLRRDEGPAKKQPPRVSPTSSSPGRRSGGPGGGSSAEEQTEDFTATLMSSPGGRILVGLVGLVVLGIAGYHVDWTKKFLHDLREHPATGPSRRGGSGTSPRASRSSSSGSSSSSPPGEPTPSRRRASTALKTLKDQPFGPFLLTLVAVGIAAYGVLLRPTLRAGLRRGLHGNRLAAAGARRRLTAQVVRARSAHTTPLRMPTRMSEMWWAPR